MTKTLTKKKPLAKKEPLAHKKPLANKKPNKNKPNAQKPCWLALRFSALPLEAHERDIHVDKAIIINEAQRVCALTPYAKKQGIKLEMPTATAQLLTECQSYERTPNKEIEILTNICIALYEFTPYIEQYTSPKTLLSPYTTQQYGVFLELSRCTKLFKGINLLTQNIYQKLKQLDYTVKSNLGHTKHAAWLLTYMPNANTVYGNKSICLELLRHIRIEAIEGFPDVINSLKQMGFSLIGDIMKHIEYKKSEDDPQGLSTFRQRFRPEFIDYLEETFDIEHSFQQSSLFKKPIKELVVEEDFVEHIQFEYPVSNTEQLRPAIESLLQQLASFLTQKQKQTQAIHWHIYDIYQEKKTFIVPLERFHSDYKLAMELTMIQLENQSLPFEVDIIELGSPRLLPAHFENRQAMFERGNKKIEFHDSFTLTSARLKARMGDDAIFKVGYKDAHLPEESHEKVGVMEEAETYLRSNHNTSPRPSWIFSSPAPIGKRQNDLYWKGYLQILHGPERIEGHWWNKPTARDYFVAKRDDETRVWIFYDLYKDEWYVHGVFA